SSDSRQHPIFIDPSAWTLFWRRFSRTSSTLGLIDQPRFKGASSSWPNPPHERLREGAFRRRGDQAIMNLKERTYLCYVSVLRIYVGYYMLHQGIGKFQRNFPKGDWVGRQIGEV